MKMKEAVGVVGFEATYEAVRLGKQVALSNKEVLVAAGELVMAATAKTGREMLPLVRPSQKACPTRRYGAHTNRPASLEYKHLIAKMQEAA